MLLCSCSSIPKGTNTQSNSYLLKQFSKICLDGSGKGRIELVGSKYTFGYESLIDRPKNVFHLALDFPIIGETKVSLSLNPKDVSKQINKTELVALLKENLGNRADNTQIIKTIEEFFVFASDFIHYRSNKVFPKHFSASSLNDHFLLSRGTANYLFIVDNFSDNQKFFERTVFKIFAKAQPSADPIMTLFLVPQTCESI